MNPFFCALYICEKKTSHICKLPFSFIEKEQLKVKVWMDRELKVYIKGKCDTVYIIKPYEKIIERKIPIRYYEKTPWYKTLLNNIIGISLSLLLVYFTYRLMRKHLL
jgi:hypothetical protein